MSSLNARANVSRVKKNDVIYTPKPVALRMIELCNITPDMKVLDPCYGGGVFYENLPDCDKHWCEIAKGKDFFSETDKYDLIIGNPPYSLWSKWIDHTIKLTDKFCYIFGYLNFTPFRIEELMQKGFGITHLTYVQVDWWFGSSVLAIFERNKPSIVQTLPRVFCDVCGKKCNRGTAGYSWNECSPKPGKKKKQTTATITVTPAYYAQITSQEN